MKILLVNTSIYTDILVYPLGLDYLVSYLHDFGYTEIDTLDLTVTVSSQRKQGRQNSALVVIILRLKVVIMSLMP